MPESVKNVCPLKEGFKCPIMKCKRPTKGVVKMIKDGRCYAEMCPSVNKLVYNNPWDGFGSKTEYNPNEFSTKSLRRAN